MQFIICILGNSFQWPPERNSALANSHVVKDVPPYSIAGGNPAKVIKYRFNKEVIDKLLAIQWWHWSDEKISKNSAYFIKDDVKAFCDCFYDQAVEEREKIEKTDIKKLKHTYLFFADFDTSFCIWDRVIREFSIKFREEADRLLIIYVNEKYVSSDNNKVNELKDYIEQMLINQKSKCTVTVHIDNCENEKAVFKNADYFITNRSKDTILHSCYADENNIIIISGVDSPIF